MDYLPLYVAGPIITKSKVKSDSTQSKSSPRPVHKLHDYDNFYSKASDSELPYLPLVHLIYAYSFDKIYFLFLKNKARAVSFWAIA